MDLKPWGVYAVFSLISAVILLTVGMIAVSKPAKIPGRLQNLMELAVGGLKDLFSEALGPHAQQHLPLVLSLFFYILVGNLLGLVPGFTSPTASTSVTVALGIIVFFYVQYIGIKSRGILGYLKHFVGPLLALCWLFIPIEIIGELAKPFSLAMRLFGNIFGEDKIAELAAGAGKHFFIPFQFPVYLLQIFTDLVQAFIFSLLTCAYISIISSHDEDEGAHDDDPQARVASAH
jgi:F-type H+-transporting ATPase subunit a